MSADSLPEKRKNRLTPINEPAQIKSLKPRDKTYETPVKDCKGLRLRTSPRGKLTWMYRYVSPITRRTVKMTLGVYIVPRVGMPAEGMTLAQARRRWSGLNAVVQNKGDPNLEKKHQDAAELKQGVLDSSRAKSKASNLVKAYIASISNQNRDTYLKSWRDIERILTKNFLDYTNGTGVALKERSVFDITKSEIRGALDELRDEGKYVASNRALASIRRVFNWAMEADWPSEGDAIPFNPAQGLKATKEQPRQRALNDTELRNVLHGLPQLLSAQISDFLLFCLATGCRVGEAAAMQYGDVFGDEWRQPPGKNGFTHTVLLSDYAREILRRQPGADEAVVMSHSPVWPNKRAHDGRISVRQVASELASVIPALGVDKFTAHDLRRTLTTWLGNRQVDERIHDRILNHQRHSIQRVYNTARYDRPAQQWWQAWGDHLNVLSADNVVAINVVAELEDRA